MYSEKFLKRLYKTISEFISCNAADVSTQRALKKKLYTQGVLQGHSKGTWSIRRLFTWAFKALEALHLADLVKKRCHISAVHGNVTHALLKKNQ